MVYNAGRENILSAYNSMTKSLGTRKHDTNGHAIMQVGFVITAGRMTKTLANACKQACRVTVRHHNKCGLHNRGGRRGGVVEGHNTVSGVSKMKADSLLLNTG